MSRITVFAVALVASWVAVPSPAAAVSGPELEAARQELRLRTETERRMRRDFEGLLAEGRLSAQEIADFEDYLMSLGMLVDQQRRVVARLEGSEPQAAAGAPGGEPLPADFHRGHTEQEKIAMLDAELGSSLSAFDEKLLREQQELAEKSRAASTSDGAERRGERDGDTAEGGGSGGAEGRAGEKPGEERGAAGEQGAQGAQGAEGARGAEGEQSGDRTEAGQPDGTAGEAGEGGEQVASAGGPGDSVGHTGKTGVPPDIPDGKDDDVVARQLREAAENEQDPELREKLWDEYRRYKAGTR